MEQNPDISFKTISDAILESTDIKDIFKRDNIYPEWCIQDSSFIFYYINYLKKNAPYLYMDVFKGLRKRSLFLYRQFLQIMDGYQNADLWLKKAIEFFQREEWFFDPTRKKFYSLDGIISLYWNFLNRKYPKFNIEIVNSIRPIIIERYISDQTWVDNTFTGLNKKSKDYIKIYDTDAKYILLRKITFEKSTREVREKKLEIERAKQAKREEIKKKFIFSLSKIL